DVLPAPLGPMMARISPLRMSKETSVSALTPPKDSETFSTDSRTSPAATSLFPGALMPRFPSRYPSPERQGNTASCDYGRIHDRRSPGRGLPGPSTSCLAQRNERRGWPAFAGHDAERQDAYETHSCRGFQSRLGRDSRHVADLDARRDHPLMSVLERHFGRD